MHSGLGASSLPTSEKLLFKAECGNVIAAQTQNKPLMDPETDKSVFDTVLFDNGDYYEGYVLNRVPHGEGTMFYDSGETVSGRWIYGEYVLGRRDEKIPGGTRDRFIVNDHTFYVGYGYSDEVIVRAFGVSGFIRGIRIHQDIAVLLSTGNSIYRDGTGWIKDSDGEPVFEYTGEGKSGDQTMTAGNNFLKRSVSTGSRVYLFVKRKPNEYVFHGQVVVKRVGTAHEPDASGHDRKVFKFILARV